MDTWGRLEDVAKDFGVSAVSPLSPLFDDIVRMNRQKMPKKEIYVKRLETGEDGKASILPIPDSHIGHRCSDINLLVECVNYISEKKGCYTILLGDTIENATRTSVGLGMFEEDMHLREQLITICEILEPLRNSGKILGIHTGNHEFRSAVLTGINPMELVANNLRVPYLEYQAFYVLEVGDQSYQMMSSHGIGGGRTHGAKANAAERLADVAPLCDLYLSAHSHAKHVHENTKFYIQDNKLHPKKQYYVICGSFMTYFGGYGEMKILPPGTTGFPRVDFHSQSHDIQVLV